MIEPETSEQLLARVPEGRTVTLTRDTDTWFQEVRGSNSQIVYFKEVILSDGVEEVFEEWWGYNDAGQVTYNKDSSGFESWHAYAKDGEYAGFKGRHGTATGIYAIEDELAADEGLEVTDKALEQRLEAIESSIDHMSDQMNLIIKVMSVEYKLGETND